MYVCMYTFDLFGNKWTFNCAKDICNINHFADKRKRCGCHVGYLAACLLLLATWSVAASGTTHQRLATGWLPAVRWPFPVVACECRAQRPLFSIWLPLYLHCPLVVFVMIQEAEIQLYNLYVNMLSFQFAFGICCCCYFALFCGRVLYAFTPRRRTCTWSLGRFT